MNPDQIWVEYKKNKRLSGRALLALKKLLRESGEPYSTITLVGDTAAFQLGEDILPYLNSPDPMVRWNAAAVLFGRFRDIRFARECYELLEREPDTLVRSVVLTGLGELLPLLKDKNLQKLFAEKLRDVFISEEEFPEIREAAYEGMEAAVGIPLLERAPAHRSLDFNKDVKPKVIAAFFCVYNV